MRLLGGSVDGNKFGHTTQDGGERFVRHVVAAAVSARSTCSLCPAAATSRSTSVTPTAPSTSAGSTATSAVGHDLSDHAATDSHDMLPYLQGQRDKVRDTHVHNTYPGQYAIRHGDWLLIDAANGYRSRGFDDWEKRRDYPKDDALDHELYNFARDPGQRNNLAAEHPEIVTRLRRLLEQSRALEGN